MENEKNNKPETNDRKDIAILISVGAIIIACICCLLIVAGYYLYNDLISSDTASLTNTPGFTPVIKEEFNSNRNDWTEGTLSDEYGTATYTINGSYLWEITADKPVNQKSWALKAPNLSDFTINVDATHESGAENASYGILFRVVDTDNLYYFSISDVGYYYVGLLQDGNWTTLIDWKETALINVNGLNQLKVVGNGDEFIFYINNQEVDNLTDSTFDNGTGGLAIELYDPGDISTFEFDNFTLSTP
jgi:hypothetical protein